MRALSTGLVVATSLLALPAFAQEPAAQPAAAKVDERVARNCVNLGQIRRTHVISDETIVFQMSGGRYYQNDLPNRCPRLGFERSFSYATSITQLCNVDIITVLQNFGNTIQPGAACGLGKFEPISKEEFAALKESRKSKGKKKDAAETSR